MTIVTIIYFSIGCIISKRVKYLRSFGNIFPFLLLFLWLPVVIILVLAMVLMKTCPGFILKHLLGWKIDEWSYNKLKSNLLEEKSILVMAPHTSLWDAVIGKLALLSLNIPHTILSSAHLFTWPVKPFMEYGLNAIPIGGIPGKNAILEVSDYLKDHNTNIIICPEGQLKATEKWNPGFYYMAYKSEAPIILSTIDYEERTVKFYTSVLPMTLSKDEIFQIMNSWYKNNGRARYPEQFKLPTNFKKKNEQPK